MEKIETIRLSVIEDPKKSYRKRAQALNMKPTSLLKILRKDFKNFRINAILYSCSVMPTKHAVRLVMCLRFRQEIGNRNDWIKNVRFTDEAQFY